MPEGVDLYAALGVAPTATPEEIRRAYRTLVRRHHPDTRAGSASSAVEPRADEGDRALQQAVAAYAVLGDPEARALYDRTRGARPGHPIPVRHREPTRRASGGEPDIRVGPVRWHRTSR